MTCSGGGSVRFSRASAGGGDSTRSIPHCLAFSLLGIVAVARATSKGEVRRRPSKHGSHKRSDAAELHLCVEGVKVHHALKTAERYLRKLDCIDGVEAEAPRAQGRPRPLKLPGNFEADREQLARFINMLPTRRRYAFGFRHPSCTSMVSLTC